MKHTPLFDCHLRDAASMINLKGYARAMEYVGHAVEHRATRERVTLCDVSHMGEIDFQGPDALSLVQRLITNDAARLSINQALYSVMCNDDGVVIDDLVCFRLASDHFRWVVNVTKTDEDYLWVLKHSRGMDVAVRNISTDTALMALQGPESREVLQRVTMADLSDLRYYWLVQTRMHTSRGEVTCLISRTGYTGERGYEIMVERDLALPVWEELLLVGRPLGIVPQGVAARESLRTEAGYLLNGNDMDGSTNPFEAGLGWVVKPTKDFIGKNALVRLKREGVARQLVGVEVEGHQTVRHGYRIFRRGGEVGRITSGPLSSHLAGRNLGLAYLATQHADIGTVVEVDIRGALVRARVVPLPFSPRRAKEEPAVSTYSPYHLRFAESHLWAMAENERTDVVTVGLSDFMQRSLGEILSVTLPKVGSAIAKNASAGWVDTYRRPFDVVSPVQGVVIEVNEGVAQKPSLINAYPFAHSGLFKVRVTDRGDYESLMDFARYAARVTRLRQYDEWKKDQKIT